MLVMSFTGFDPTRILERLGASCRFGDVTGGVDEEFRDRTKHAIFQCNKTNRSAS